MTIKSTLLVAALAILTASTAFAQRGGGGGGGGGGSGTGGASESGGSSGGAQALMVLGRVPNNTFRVPKVQPRPKVLQVTGTGCDYQYYPRSGQRLHDCYRPLVLR